MTSRITVQQLHNPNDVTELLPVPGQVDTQREQDLV